MSTRTHTGWQGEGGGLQLPTGWQGVGGGLQIPTLEPTHVPASDPSYLYPTYVYSNS